VLKTAARANLPPSPSWNLIKFAAIAFAGTAGTIWFLNLPFPMIRYPVARVAPFVLLPSYISMDRNYRQAIMLTEQADQLVNQATTSADLQLGAEKVKGAQKSLDALPVWFLGYYPSFYCSWFRCAWGFTLDEFQGARRQVARMEAKLFQEQNAQKQLEQSDQALTVAKQQYQQASDQAKKAAAIAQWQEAIDQMHQIPDATLAGRMAQPKLTAYDRDFQQVSGLAAGAVQTGNLIGAAKEFAKTAQQLEQGTAHIAAEWQEIQNFWEEAISRLQKVDEKDPDYLEAQKLLANYQKRVSNARIRFQGEQDSARAYEAAQQLMQSLYDSIPANAKSLTPSQVALLQQIVTELRKVKPETTVYPNAQVMLKAAEARLK
jgi:hypothetical protein